jgi:endonuclease-8
MPEGDTIFRAARTLHRALAGHTVTRFESVLPALMRVDHDRRLAGRTIESVTARGKHLLMAFSGDLVLHTHMRMNGSWHLYRPHERWRRPARDMRLVIATARFVAVGFTVPVAEFLTARDLERHKELQQLGPDLLAAAFDVQEMLRRMRARGTDPIGDVLLNQRVMSGIGNVLKSEILFVARLDPFIPVRDLSDADLDRIVAVARRLLAVNALDGSRTVGAASGRRTTGSLDPHAKLWVYARGGKPCRACGRLIRSKQTGADARLTYWCAACQTTGETSERRATACDAQSLVTDVRGAIPNAPSDAVKRSGVSARLTLPAKKR